MCTQKFRRKQRSEGGDEDVEENESSDSEDDRTDESEDEGTDRKEKQGPTNDDFDNFYSGEEGNVERPSN